MVKREKERMERMERMTKTNARNTQGKTQDFQGEAATCKTEQTKSSNVMQEDVCVKPIVESQNS